MQVPTQIERALSLAHSGQPREAVEYLSDLARRGDGAANYQLAEWTREGEFVERNFRLARDFYLRAAQAGVLEAYRRYMAFLAVGVGGPRDWKLSLDLLADLAKIDPVAARQRDVVDVMELTPAGDPMVVPHGEILSESPHVESFPGLLTDLECNFLVEAAEPLFEAAHTVEEYTGRTFRNPIRTSDTAVFPWVAESPAIHAINRRIASASGTQPEQGEPLQVLRYQEGQEYKPHEDAIPGLENQRIVTALIYLNDEFEGGETEFPKIPLTVRPRRGDGLLFHNIDAERHPDPAILHAGLPVRSGIKLLASRWIRESAISG